MTIKRFLLAAAVLLGLSSLRAEACTNIIITKGASADGSCMVSYAADSHWLFGELYFRPAGKFAKGAKLPIIEWDTYKPLGEIDQVPRTYQTVGNMNQYQVAIGETTWGGRLELMDSTGIMDYGSLIYVSLQRARTAREAIETIVSLANRYGYPSEGETFSIIDKEEAWVMDLIGKGPDNKGIVWVARRIPDGYICAHANQARITRFPLDDPETLYAPDVISFAREKGYYDGPDSLFSFREAYCPLDFGTVRGCDARVWSAFNRLGDGKFTHDGITEPSSAYLNYAMGYDIAGEMPLWIKPSRGITPKDVADAMRDHYEGTPMDMTKDIGAGGKELGGAPAGADMDGEVETAVQPVFEGIADAGEELVAALEGVVPVGGKAIDDFGLDIDEPVDGDAVGEADVGIAEYAKGAPVVDVGTDGFNHIDGGGEVVGLEVQRGGLLFAGTDNLVDVLAKGSGADGHQKGEYDDAACVFHCRIVYCPGQGLCV